MDSAKYGPFILIGLGLLILFFQFHIVYFNIYYLILIPLVLIVIIIVIKKGSKLFGDIYIKNNVFTVKVDNKSVSGIVLKILGKQEVDSQNSNLLQRELDSLLDTLARHSSNVKYTVITNVRNKRKTSALVIYKECENCEEEILKEYRTLQEIAESVAPHIIFQLTNPTRELIPMPSSFGNLAYARVFDKIFESPKSDGSEVEFDVELGHYLTPTLSSIPIGIRSKDVFRHIGIFGTTGSGKSNTAAVIASELIKLGFRVIIFDWHGEYVEKSKSFKVLSNDNLIKLNIFKLDNIDEITEILSEVLQLTDPQRFMLYVLLLKMRKVNNFTLKNIISILSQIGSASNWSREVKMALIRKIYIMFTEEGKRLFLTNSSVSDIMKLLKDNSGIVVNLNSIKNLKLRKLYALFLIKLLTDLYMDKILEYPVILVIEEAHNYFSSDNEFTNKLISEIRKFGVGLCIVTQSPSSISLEVLKNTNIKIIHAIKADLDKRIISDSLSLSQNLISIMDKLDQGEAILSSPNIKQPIIVKIKKIEYI